MQATITAKNSKHQAKANKWSKLQEQYRVTVNAIDQAEDNGEEKKADRLRVKEEDVYSRILDLEDMMPKTELDNCKRAFKNHYGYTA